MSETRTYDSMTVFRSFVEATADLPAEQFKEAWLAILHYGMDGVEDQVSAVTKMFFVMAKPVLDKGRTKKENAGSKTEANASKRGANQSKPEANGDRNRIRNRNRSKEEDKDQDMEMDKELEKEQEVEIIDTSCPEPSSDPPADVEAVILNDGSEWVPTVSELEEYERLYPAVDVRQEFANMRGWCRGNPTKRKTLSGVKRFVASWLAKEQNRPHGRASPVNRYSDIDVWASGGVT